MIHWIIHSIFSSFVLLLLVLVFGGGVREGSGRSTAILFLGRRVRRGGGGGAGGGAGGNTIVTRDIENINQASSSSFFSFSAKGGEKVAAARDVALVSALPGAKFQIPASFLLASRRKEEQRWARENKFEIKSNQNPRRDKNRKEKKRKERKKDKIEMRMKTIHKMKRTKKKRENNNNNNNCNNNHDNHDNDNIFKLKWDLVLYKSTSRHWSSPLRWREGGRG